jgi:hypothetical protein
MHTAAMASAQASASESKRLTPKQQAFVAFKLANPQATDAEAAVAAGYSPNDTSRGARIANAPQVRAALNAHIAVVNERAELTREAHLYELQRLRDLAASQGQLSAAITAEHHRGKVGGFYVDKVDATHKGDPTAPLNIVVTRRVIRPDADA